ncbi:MAG TPA: hypothetical protein VMF58_14015 [Rhizomicrobium sp.]|nr:hypothetical protein [Rhizomicrobium sp.]
MGMARLLAKGWVVFCLFAGAHALNFAIGSGTPAIEALRTISLCTLLFAAMGLLFVGGYAAATDHGGSLLQRIKPHHFLPGFNEMTFVVFVALSFAAQVWFAPQVMQWPVADGIRAAISFVVPGQRLIEDDLLRCGLDGGRNFASAFVWFLAAVYFASAASRLRLAAGLIRLERVQRPEAMGASLLALVQGALAVVGIQLLFVGSAYQGLPCSAFTELDGALLLGLAPLLLAYLTVAALANLLASGSAE